MYFPSSTEKNLKCLSSFYEHTLKLDQLEAGQRARIRQNLIERIENLSLFGYLEGNYECLELANDLSTVVYGKPLCDLSDKPFFQCVEAFDPFWLFSAYEYSHQIKKTSFKMSAKKVLKEQEYLPFKKLQNRIQRIFDLYSEGSAGGKVSIHDYRIIQICHLISMEKDSESNLSLDMVRQKVLGQSFKRIVKSSLKATELMQSLPPLGDLICNLDMRSMMQSIGRKRGLILALSYHTDFTSDSLIIQDLEDSYSKSAISKCQQILERFYVSCRDGERLESLKIHETLQVVYCFSSFEARHKKNTVERICSYRISNIAECNKEVAQNLESLYPSIAKTKSWSHAISLLKVSDSSMGRWVMDTVRKSSVDLGSEVFEAKRVKAAIERHRSSEYKLDLSLLPKSQQTTLQGFRNLSESSTNLPSARMQIRVLVEKNLKQIVADLRNHYESLRKKLLQKRLSGKLFTLKGKSNQHPLAFKNKGKQAYISKRGVMNIPSRWPPEEKLKEIQCLMPRAEKGLKITYQIELFQPLIFFYEQFVTYLEQGIVFASNDRRRQRFVENSWNLAKLLYQDQNYDLLNAWYVALNSVPVSRIPKIQDFLEAKSEHKVMKLFADRRFSLYRERIQKHGSKKAIRQLSIFLGDFTRSQEVNDRENHNILLALTYDQSYFSFKVRGSRRQRHKTQTIDEILSIQSTIADMSTKNLLFDASYLVKPHMESPSKITDRLQHCHNDSLINDIAHDLNRRSAFIYASLFQSGKSDVHLTGESLTNQFQALSDDFRYSQQFYEQFIEQSLASETDIVATENLIDLSGKLYSSSNHFALLALWPIVRRQARKVKLSKKYQIRLQSLFRKIGRSGESLITKKVHLPYPFFFRYFPMRAGVRCSDLDECPEDFWRQVTRYLKSFGSYEINPSSLKTSILQEIQTYQKEDKKQNRHISRARMLASAGEVSKKNNLVRDFVESRKSSGKLFTLSYLRSLS